ncbi:DUF4328 domain-containing protein [Pseudonocardia lacus]|uniref:DUF4328 domain-containing protein n=1 Tax=Pseudonocardia lacus TaxID=2835865 RepID=UPI001BDC35DA|nr:DUF4328 domain-containing protein [Pseudonocardia lacus]
MQPSPDALTGAPCPRCGRPAPPGAGRFCPYCGRYLAALTWVAEPPPGAGPEPSEPPPPPYSGPPRYRYLPRWGFPARAWQPPGADGTPPPDPVWRARSTAASVVPVLWATAAVALLAAAAEAWRYALLLASRDGALDAATVAASDAFVDAAGTVAPILTVLAGGLLVLWSVRARQAAAELAGVRPSRSTAAVVLGWLVPGANLVVPGAVLAEVEHTALLLPAARRPRPSRLLLAWWVAWAVGGVLTVVVLLWSFRTGVQARADGVVLHAALDLLAVVTAVLTALLVTRMTRMLAPVGRARREILVSATA